MLIHSLFRRVFVFFGCLLALFQTYNYCWADCDDSKFYKVDPRCDVQRRLLEVISNAEQIKKIVKAHRRHIKQSRWVDDQLKQLVDGKPPKLPLKPKPRHYATALKTLGPQELALLTLCYKKLCDHLLSVGIEGSAGLFLRTATNSIETMRGQVEALGGFVQCDYDMNSLAECEKEFTNTIKRASGDYQDFKCRHARFLEKCLGQ